jgi:hypothetical protein
MGHIIPCKGSGNVMCHAVTLPHITICIANRIYGFDIANTFITNEGSVIRIGSGDTA